MYSSLYVNHTSIKRFKKEKKTSLKTSLIHENIERRRRTYACADSFQRKKKAVIVGNVIEVLKKKKTKTENKDKET